MAPTGMWPLTPRDRGLLHVPASSSPDLPTVQEIISQKAKNQPLRGVSKAAPIPEDATATFTSASSLWRSLKAADVTGSGSAAAALVPEEVEDAPVSAVGDNSAEFEAKGRKPRRRKQSTAPKAEATTQCVASYSPNNKEKPWKKFKSPSKERNTSARGGAGTAQNGPVASQEEETNKASNFFATPVRAKPEQLQPVIEETEGPIDAAKPRPQMGLIEDASDETPQNAETTALSKTKAKAKARKTAERRDDEPLQLEIAMARRTEWTPPAAKTHIIFDSDSPAPEEGRGSQVDSVGSTNFGQLLATYKCDKALRERTAASDEESGFLRKRKLVELVEVGSAKAAAPAELEAHGNCPAKQKAPKKKPRTITALATAAYRPATQLDTHADKEKEPASTMLKPSETGKGNPKARRRAAKAPKKKKAPPPKPILLSPRAAMRQVSNQDFVFGTSSQLAREQSPSLLRDLQAAMRFSNQLDCVDLVTPFNSDTVEPVEKRPSLWEAAARDADGDVFDVEVFNLANGSQQLPQTTAEDDPFGYVKMAEDAPELPLLPTTASDGLRGDEDSLLILSDMLPALTQTRSKSVGSGTPTPCGEGVAAEAEMTPEAQAEGARASIQAQEAEDRGCLAETESCTIERAKPPAFELYSDAQLATQIAQYGFKPIKKRTAMLALLEQCWRPPGQQTAGAARLASTTAQGPSHGRAGAAPSGEGEVVGEKRRRGRPRKHGVSETATEPPQSGQSCEPPKRPRGRPRKDSGSGATATKEAASPVTPKRRARRAVIEIPDSASDFSSVGLSSSPQQPVDLEASVGEDTELSLAMSPTDEQAEVMGYIGKAVTTAARTTDPAKPSWHEKILLYDPIVLEDLTAWLNCGQLTRVGFDGEVSSDEVKRWCESRSICCLWRVNLRGRERKRL